MILEFEILAIYPLVLMSVWRWLYVEMQRKTIEDRRISSGIRIDRLSAWITLSRHADLAMICWNVQSRQTINIRLSNGPYDRYNFKRTICEQQNSAWYDGATLPNCCRADCFVSIIINRTGWAIRRYRSFNKQLLLLSIREFDRIRQCPALE